MTYKKSWKKNSFFSLITYIRDLTLFFWPGRLPRYFFRRLLLGSCPDYVFVVHPRRKEDIFRACGFFKPIRSILGRDAFFRFLAVLPPVILGKVKAPNGVTGIVITSTWLPEALLSNRRGAVLEGRRCLKLASKLIDPWQPVGLGGWWPIVTRRGLELKKYAHYLRVTITNGHCGTLCSIYRSIEKLSRLSNLRMSEFSIFILGAGKMGSNIAKTLLGTVKQVSLFDKNHAKLEKLAKELSAISSTTTVSMVGKEPGQLKRALEVHHLCVCSTSNIRRIIKPDELPNSVIVLDDSRPEAFPRIYDYSRNIAVLEGGLMKIEGCTSDYDFGFGTNDNVFGCLAEAYLLACCRNGGRLLPTLGDVSLANFSKMLSMHKKYSVFAGDFKSGHSEIDGAWLANILLGKTRSATGRKPVGNGKGNLEQAANITIFGKC